ncbi:MAG: phosphatase PAP2 family protein, partial [Hyphomicrobiales bacterium]|nr:phosphatase PAP2 family protein [Hyphomicrobiales bacterium]
MILRGLAWRVERLTASAGAAPCDLVPGAGSFIAAVLLLLVAAFALDRPVASAMRHLPGPVTRFFEDITILGEGSVWLVPIAIVGFGLAWASFGGTSRESRARLVIRAERALFMFSAIGLPSLVTTLLKHLVGRMRPRYFETLGAFHFEPFSLAASKASFPSGHATTAAALIIAFGVVAPRWRSSVAVLAALVFLSRMAVEAHYVSDILAGALIGIAGARAMRTLFARTRIGLRSRVLLGEPRPEAAISIPEGGMMHRWSRGDVADELLPENELLPKPRLSIVVPMRNEAGNVG